ncbi:MAG: copper chaperone [Gammaproteobacteria bacterium]|nr:copper chaperone [Gammaproteobacteria bacterium]
MMALALLLPLVAANAASMTYTLQVDGLACPFCAYGIEKKLSSIKGVAKVDVDIKHGLVVVTMTEGAELSEQLARDKVKDAGFTLRSFSRIP